MDNVDFGQRGRTLSLSTARNLDFGQRGFCHGVDFFSRNEWQWLFGKWGTDPGPLLRLLALSLPFRGNSSIEITVNPENEASSYDHDLDSADLQLHAVCLRIREGVHAPFFLTSHSSATRHQWLNLFSTRHECFTSDVGLTRTRLVSCILLTSLMAFSYRGLSRSRFNRPSPGFNRNSPVSFAPCFGPQMREWLSLSQRPRPVSLWNGVPLTLIARRWPCAFFLSDSQGMLDVKDTVLRRELASIALATRKTKNFFRGMLSAFRAGERHRCAW